MKKKAFCNLAWQMYVDQAKALGSDFVTTASASGSASAAASAASGDIRTAVVAQNPSMDNVGIAAEELVDTVIRLKINSGELPLEVASPNHNAAWDSHSAAP